MTTMLPLSRPPLHHRVVEALDAMNASYASNKTPLWDSFRNDKVRREWQVFHVVWAALRAMSFLKCALCESPQPDTVEHIAPKAAPGNVALVFAWENLLPACDTCNRRRQNSGIGSALLDPSNPPGDLLDVLGWDDKGVCSAVGSQYTQLVDDTVRAYGLARFNDQRRTHVRRVRFVLARAFEQAVLDDETRTRLIEELDAGTPWLGAVREYLLRPPTPRERELVARTFRKHALLPDLVAPWLRPPPGLLPPWLP